LAGKLVVVIGLTGAGKPTLSRFLAWYFNTSMLEADFYLRPNDGFNCDPNQVERIISQRHKMQRSLIVEGGTILSLLKEIDQRPDAIVHVRNSTSKWQPTEKEPPELNSGKWGFDSCPIYHMEVEHD